VNKADPFARAEDSGDIHLRFLATSDIHCELMAYDYYTDSPGGDVGFIRTASLIAQARADAQNVLLVDAGDCLQGAPVGDLWAQEPERLNHGPHPVIAAMNAAGVEASTLGNHDFNYGLDYLDRCLEGADYPVVNANITRGPLAADPADDVHRFAPYALLEREYVTRGGETRQLKVGVIGFCPPQIMGWDAQLLTGQVEARDVVEAARVQLPRLRAAGADIVVALSHGGITPRPSQPWREQFARDLAEVGGIDVMALGHQHAVFPGPELATRPGIDPSAGTLEGVPAVMPGFGGRNLGVIDLKLRETDSGWSVICHDARVWPIAQAEEDGTFVPMVEDEPKVATVLAPAHDDVLAFIRRPIAQNAAPITTYFATLTNTVALQLVAEAQADLAKGALKDSEWADLPVLSVAAPFKAGGIFGPSYYTCIEAGQIELKHLLDLYLYPNTVCACALTGAQVREWIERAAGIFRQVQPGAADAPLLDMDYPTYNYDVICGLTYQIDLSKPARYSLQGTLATPQERRVTNMVYNGAPVADDDRFLLVTNSYRAGGGGQFPGADGTTKVWQCGETARDVLINQIKAEGLLKREPKPGWSFVPMPGTTILYPSAPEASGFLPVDVAVDPVGPGPDGFYMYRVAL